MANAHIVEFAVFRGADEATIKSRAEAASKVAGLVTQYGGQKLEDANESVHVTGKSATLCQSPLTFDGLMSISRPSPPTLNSALF